MSRAQAITAMVSVNPAAGLAFKMPPDGPTAGRASAATVAAAAGLAATARADPPAGLTGRELQVLRLVARGLATKEVARRLGVSVKTADHHIQRVYDKTGVRARAGVTLFAIEQGLLA